jgi:hypothetical protein
MTKPTLTPDQCAALGVTPEHLGDSEVLEAQPESVAQGFASTGSLIDAVPGFTSTHHDIGALLGFDLATTRNRSMIQVANVDGDALTIRTFGDVESTNVEGSAACVAFRLGVGACFLARRPVGPAIVGRFVDGHIEIAAVKEADEAATATVPLKVEGLVDVPPCPALAALALDPWSAEQIAAWLADGSSVARAAAVGAAARLALPRDAAAEVAARMAGKIPERIAVVTEWVAGLSDDAVRSLEERAVAAVDGLHDLVATIESLESEDDATARATLVLHACEERETLACVDDVLQRSGRASRFEAVINGLDRVATVVIGALVRPRLTAWSPLLGRASIGHPDVWWVAPLADLPAAKR